MSDQVKFLQLGVTVFGALLLAVAVTSAVTDLDRYCRPRPHARSRRLVLLAVSALLAGGTLSQLRILAARDTIYDAIEAYRVFGDRRANFIRGASIRRDVYDCTGNPADALAQTQLRWPVDSSEPSVVRRADAPWPPEAVSPDPAITAPLAFALDGAARAPRVADLWTSASPEPASRISLCRAAMMRAHELLASTGKRSTVLVQEPSSGRVLVFADFQPAPDSFHRLLAVHETRAPGSVAKLFAVAVALGGRIALDNLPCPATLMVGMRAIHNAHGLHYRRGTAADALVTSCNTATVLLLQRSIALLGIDSVARSYSALGVAAVAAPFGARDNTWWTSTKDVSGRGLTPPVPSVRLDSAMPPWDVAQAAIGQGTWVIAPIQLLRFVSAIANKGIAVRQTLDWSAGLTPLETRIMRSDVAAYLRDAMIGVVDHGTGTAARRGAVAAIDSSLVLAGKTGTPWRLERSGDRKRMTKVEDGLFAGFVTDPRPQGVAPLAIVVFIEGGGPGARLATVIADSVAAAVLATYRPGSAAQRLARTR